MIAHNVDDCGASISSLRVHDRVSTKLTRLFVFEQCNVIMRTAVHIKALSARVSSPLAWFLISASWRYVFVLTGGPTGTLYSQPKEPNGGTAVTSGGSLRP